MPSSLVTHSVYWNAPCAGLGFGLLTDRTGRTCRRPSRETLRCSGFRDSVAGADLRPDRLTLEIVRRPEIAAVVAVGEREIDIEASVFLVVEHERAVRRRQRVRTRGLNAIFQRASNSRVTRDGLFHGLAITTPSYVMLWYPIAESRCSIERASPPRSSRRSRSARSCISHGRSVTFGGRTARPACQAAFAPCASPVFRRTSPTRRDALATA